MKNIFGLAPHTRINPDEPYHLAYPHLVSYFFSVEQIYASDVIRAAHMAYGWMPTVLEMHWTRGSETELSDVANTLSNARAGQDATKTELERMVSLVNKSLVGVSKLLHFAAPARYPIWDSRVYRFLNGKTPHHYRLNDIDTFLKYVSAIRNITQDERMAQAHTLIQQRLGYTITAIRAAELIMFIHGAPIKNNMT